MSGFISMKNLKIAKCSRRCEPYDCVRMGVALLLLIAAVLKIYELLTQPVSPSTKSVVIDGRSARIVIVEVELFLGLCLLLGIGRKASWTAVVALFGVFSIYSATMFNTGADTCKCFGAIKVRPIWSFLLDLTTLAALLIFRPSGPISVRQAFHPQAIPLNIRAWLFGFFSPIFQTPRFGFEERRKAITPTVVVALVLLSGIILVLSEPTSKLSHPGLEIVNGRFALVEPNKWVGKRLPLLDYIDVDELAKDSWVVVLYRPDCSKCEELLNGLLASRSSTDALKGCRMAIIEVPPYVGGQSLPTATFVVRGRLAPRYDWMITTPVVIRLRNGLVDSIDPA